MGNDFVFFSFFKIGKRLLHPDVTYDKLTCRRSVTVWFPEDYDTIFREEGVVIYWFWWPERPKDPNGTHQKESDRPHRSALLLGLLEIEDNKVWKHIRGGYNMTQPDTLLNSEDSNPWHRSPRERDWLTKPPSVRYSSVYLCPIPFFDFEGQLSVFSLEPRLGGRGQFRCLWRRGRLSDWLWSTLGLGHGGSVRRRTGSPWYTLLLINNKSRRFKTPSKQCVVISWLYDNNVGRHRSSDLSI